MRVRKLTAAVLSVGLAGSLAACGGESGETGAEGGGTLTYWATNMAPTLDDDAKVLQPHLDAFTEETGIEVDLEVIPWDSLYNRILTAVSSGQGPDVLNIGNTWSTSLQATGAFVEFDEERLEAIGGADKFVATSLAATGPEGQTPTAVPLYGQSYGLFYNTAMFEEAGIDQPPATWDEFVDVAEQLTQDTDGDGSTDQWGVTLVGAAIADLSHFAFILGRQHGAQLFTEDGQPQFASDQEVAAVKSYVDLMGEHEVVAPGNAEHAGTDAANDFAQGRAAMLIAQSGTRSFLEQVDFTDYAVAQVPVLDPLPPGGENIQTMVAGINISVFKDTGNEDAGLQLVEFLTRTEVQAEINKANGTLPVVVEAYDDAAFGDEAAQTFGTILQEHAEPFPQIPEVGQMETLVGGALKTLLAKAATGTVTEADVRAELENANSQMAAAVG